MMMAKTLKRTQTQIGEPAVPAKWHKSVSLDGNTYTQLDLAARNRSIPKAEFARAAITYFTETGLDPTAERITGLAELSERVGEEVLKSRKQTTDSSSSIVGVLRNWEQDSYVFAQKQQLEGYRFLRQIESNLLDQLERIQTHGIGILIERLIKTEIDSHMTRVMVERIILTSMGVTTDKGRMDQTAKSDGERDRKLVEQIRGVLEAAAGPGMTVTPLPSHTPAPPVRRRVVPPVPPTS